MKSFTLDFVTLNPNSTISKMYLRNLITPEVVHVELADRSEIAKVQI